MLKTHGIWKPAAIAAACVLLCACMKSGEPREGTLHEDQVLVHDGVDRAFHLYETTATGPRPLVLLLHGGGGTIDNHIGVGAVRWPHQIWLDIADEDGLHVVVPQGLGSQWNDCRRECRRCGDADDVGFLGQLVDHVAGRVDVDADRVYVVGESNGGFMTQRLAVETPERFAAVGVVIAAMPADSDCTEVGAPMPIMYQVGTTDSAIPYEGGKNNDQIEVMSAEDSAGYWAELNECEAVPTTTELDDLDPDDESTVRRADYSCPTDSVSLVTMDGAGHVPPSIEVQVTALWEGIAGVQNHDIEGARVFWAFLSAHRRSP